MIEAIVLAGGLGTRLRSQVSDVPKPMAPIKGQPFLSYILRYLIAQGVKHVILSVGYLHEKISTYFGENYQGIEISYAIEQQALGTGGALASALDLQDGSSPVLVMNGDTWLPTSVKALQENMEKNSADVVIATVKQPENTRYDQLIFDDLFQINSISGRESEDPHINGGVYLIAPSTFEKIKHLSPPGQKTSLERDIFPSLINDARVFAQVTDVPFIDIGIPEDYQRAGELVAQEDVINEF